MFGKKKIGVALSGGAARGISHIGVLQVLEKLGVQIDAISGCSMGAIVGAFYSVGITPEEMEQYIKSNDWRSFMLFSMFSLSRTGFVNERKVHDVLKSFLGNKTFDDCIKPFNCVAVDLIKGQKVVIDQGSLIDGVRASIAVPGMIPPVFKNNMLLIDGGLIEPLPTEAIKKLNINFTIASSISFEKENQEKEKQKEFSPEKSEKNIKRMSVQTIIDKSLSLVQEELTKKYIRKADIVIEPKIGDYGFFDFVRGIQIIDSGRKAAIAKIPEIKRRLRIR